MHEQGIRDLLKTAPYNTQSNDEVAAALNVTSQHVLSRPYFITSRTLYADLGPTDAETILQKLEAASASNPVVKRVLGWLLPSEAGVDITHPGTRGQLDALVAAGVLSSGEGSALKAIGEESKSLGQTLGLLGAGETITANQIADLR